MSVKCLLHVSEKTCNYFLGADGFFSCKNLPKPRRGPRFWWWRWFGSFARGCITVPLLLKCQKRERNIFSCSMYFSLFFFSVICSDFSKPLGGVFWCTRWSLLEVIETQFLISGHVFIHHAFGKNGHVNCELAGNCQVFRNFWGNCCSPNATPPRNKALIRS